VRDRFGIFGTVTRFRELSLLLVMMLRIPNSNTSKPISIDKNVLRKDGDGTSMIAITKHPAIHTKAIPKYVAT